MNYKRIIGILIVILFICSISGCSSNHNNANKDAYDKIESLNKITKHEVIEVPFDSNFYKTGIVIDKYTVSGSYGSTDIIQYYIKSQLDDENIYFVEVFPSEFSQYNIGDEFEGYHRYSQNRDSWGTYSSKGRIYQLMD